MTNLITEIESGRDINTLSNSEMIKLSKDIRELLVEIVHANGDAGHLASSLGAVEITLALHRIFKTPEDKILWDVGHQAYVHKILTGRLDRMSTLRQEGGLSGFPDRRESDHDAFGVGHAGTALSASTGYVLGRDLQKQDYSVVAVVGDGALTAGMSFEALNHLGDIGGNVIVILNDNEMSISPNVGAMNRNVNRMRVSPAYRDFKIELKKFVTQLPAGDRLWDEWRRLKRVPRELVVQSGFWDHLGFDYYGPIDGHDIEILESTLKSVKHFTGKPVLIHALTRKGYGVEEAEADPVKSHSGTYWLKSPISPENKKRTYSEVFGDSIGKICETNEKVVVITPAMLEGSGLTNLKKQFPNRVIDVGIAEQHAVTTAAGLAASGMKPVVAIYSTFLQRGFDSVIHDVVVQKLPVIFAIDRAGLVGEDGRTHQGFADISYLRCLPDMIVAAPSDDEELSALLNLATDHDGPFAIRYPRGAAVTEISGLTNRSLDIGKGTVLRSGSDLALIGIGSVIPDCLEVAEEFAKRNLSVAVVNARFAKPLDSELITQIAKETKGVITVEDNSLIGGFGEGVLSLLSELRMGEKFLGAIGIPDMIVEHGTQSQQRKICKIDTEGIFEQVERFIM
ncbi:MAG: 1-deoxy-D-xylulose-5-phosphate synthase [Chloroflexi bacterium]|nr:1-deoxy-D-xylulose-5-phosphate synthase [Chloroflexota bacterium]|tara:strand:+ start:11270 stop:13141 length:1872 start_codon:yes stop_codon:yes gene_type:complete